MGLADASARPPRRRDRSQRAVAALSVPVRRWAERAHEATRDVARCAGGHGTHVPEHNRRGAAPAARAGYTEPAGDPSRRPPTDIRLRRAIAVAMGRIPRTGR